MPSINLEASPHQVSNLDALILEFTVSRSVTNKCVLLKKKKKKTRMSKGGLTQGRMQGSKTNLEAITTTIYHIGNEK